MANKPVVIQYMSDVPPSPDHPSGFLAGATFEVPTPARAAKTHPKAKIIRYADGSKYVAASSGAKKTRTRKRTRKTAGTPSDTSGSTENNGTPEQGSEDA